MKLKALGLSILSSLLFASAACADPAPQLVLTPPNEYIVSELGDTQTFAVKLSKAPASKVIVKVASLDKTEGSVDKTELTFLRENWNVPQKVVVTGLDDNIADGDVKFNVELKLDYTKDEAYKSLKPLTLVFENLDDENPADVKKQDTSKNTATKTKIRIMAANTTSGAEQSYDPGEGIRIFKALKPDIVLIQEFNYSKSNIKNFVSNTFGGGYHYYRGAGRIPNGIISKYPITSSGGWASSQVSDRQWEWAVIDIPGDKDLLAVSVHLYTKSNEAEMGPLLEKIKLKMKSDKKDYYVILGGDFNQPNWNPIRDNLGSFFEIGRKPADWPVDQNGEVRTNATRHKQLDYLLCNPSLCATETPVVIGKHSYPKGHVVDSRVYSQLNELNTIAPVKADDSDAEAMQHMAVIRDFVISGN